MIQSDNVPRSDAASPSPDLLVPLAGLPAHLPQHAGRTPQAPVAEQSTLTIDAEFQALIPPLQPDERAGLEKSLLDEGCRVRLTEAASREAGE